MKDPDTELRSYDYFQINSVFDYCEQTMHELAARHKLLSVRIERWRWDVPDIAMSWRDREQYSYLNKSLRVLITKRGQGEFDYTIDINAWTDNHNYAGIATERMWNNDTYELVPRPTEGMQDKPNTLITALFAQFEIVNSWTTDDLQRHHLFVPSTR